VLALLLDIYVFRRATARGKYSQMADPDAAGKRGMPSFGYLDRSVPMESFSFRSKQAEPELRGYALPEEQLNYDTGYHGAHAEPALLRETSAVYEAGR